MIRALFVALMSAIVLSGCERTTSNIYVLSTNDCGSHWQKLSTGEMIPKHTGQPCGYNVAIPNWPMTGETKFRTQFAGKVLSKASLSYSYSITDPVSFIGEARYLGKGGSDLEISSNDSGAKYEMAENIIINKLLREMTTTITRSIDVVDANPAEIEEAIQSKVKDLLAKKGIELSDLALVIENDEQTQLAIDSVTADRVYEAAGIREVGKTIMAARAGATRVSVTTEVPQRD